MVFESEIAALLTPEDLDTTLLSDGDLGVDDIGLSLAEAIKWGGPWGQGFPEPLFDGQFELAERRIVGEHHLKMTLRLPESPQSYDAIAFHTLDEAWPDEVRNVQLAYRLDVNEYRGSRRLQFIVEHIEPVVN